MAWMLHGASLQDSGYPPRSHPIPSSSTGRPTSPPGPSSQSAYMDASSDSRVLSSSAENDGMELPSDVEMTPTESKKLLPTVFRWNGGGHEIYVSGTFDNWQKKIPMARR